MNKEKSPLHPALSILLIIFAIGMIIAGITMIGNRRTYVKTNAVITAIDVDYNYHGTESDTEYTVYVKYYLDGVQYESVLGYYDFTMKEGKEIEILCDPKEPTKVQESGFMGIIMTVAAGVGCGLLGAHQLTAYIQKKKENENVD